VKNTIAPVVAIALLLSGCAASSGSKPVAKALVTTCEFARSPTPNQLPNLKLPCLSSSGYSQDQVSLTSLKGPLVLNLWGSWCAPCKEEMPLFRKLYLATSQRKALAIIGIDVDEASLKDGLDFMATQGMAWPQLADNNQITRADFGMGIPVTWFVNAKGEVTFKQVGQIHSWTQLRNMVSAHLGIEIP
jgi:cytochrome c biogenesis protein CcmG/thiol:disulfide interchange protein DsbE